MKISKKSKDSKAMRENLKKQKAEENIKKRKMVLMKILDFRSQTDFAKNLDTIKRGLKN